jgi:hypothetical protein
MRKMNIFGHLKINGYSFAVLVNVGWIHQHVSPLGEQDMSMSLRNRELQVFLC